MKLEDIYTILKDSASLDFYVPTGTEDLIQFRLNPMFEGKKVPIKSLERNI